MKVAVITRHSIFNYGSLLQTIATQAVIEKMGYECDIIDYQRDDENYRKIASVLVKKTKWNKNAILRMIYAATQSPKFYLMGKHFENLRDGVIKTTKMYHSIDELKEDKPQADMYMTGSDQVWGAIGNDPFDPAYFLGFTDQDDVRLSYAASFGKTQFTDALLGTMKSYLEKYDAITVREQSAVDIINKMGAGKATQVLDPTLLFDSTYWSRMICDPIPKKYILVYQLHNNRQMMEYAYQLAAEKNLKLVTMSSTMQHLIHRGGKHIFLPTLSQWLGYIKNASFMITDSFHGTAFAINFNTQFVNILPEETSTRNQSILSLVGLADRVITDYNNFSCFEQKIDYDKVNDLIQEKRKESLAVLESMLKLRK